MAVQENITPVAPIAVIPFQATNIPDSTGNAKAIEPASNEYVFPWSGSIIGISAVSNAAFSTGTVTFRPTIAGTANTGLTVALSSSAQLATAKKAQGAIPFAAGDKIGVDFTKSGTVSPTTNDVVITLWVIFEGVYA